jgi:hypothetical protein
MNEWMNVLYLSRSVWQLPPPQAVNVISWETQSLPSAAVELSVAMLHCLWETRAGPEIALAISRNVSCWKNVLQHIHGGCSTHRRCFSGARRFSSKCRWLPAVVVTVRGVGCHSCEARWQWSHRTPHTEAEGRQCSGTSQSFLTPMANHKWKWASTDNIHALYVCN